MIAVDEWTGVVLVGIGATLVMDIGSVIQKALGMPVLNYAMVGRWAGHLCRGQLMHQNIGKATVIPGESALGWGIHYLTGVAFAVLLIAIEGMAWLSAPTVITTIGSLWH